MKNKELVVNKKYVGSSFDDFLKESYSKSEIELKNRKADFIIELIKTRKEQLLTQKQLEQLTGIKQPTIAKIEREMTNPSLENVLKLLNAMGKTLKIGTL